MDLLPIPNLEKLTNIIRKIFWEGNGNKNKDYLVKGDLICKRRIKGGVGIKSLKLSITVSFANGGGN
jgi:hypothetical protein